MTALQLAIDLRTSFISQMVSRLSVFALLITLAFWMPPAAAAVEYEIGELDMRGLALSPDGSEIAVAAWPDNQIEQGFLATASIETPDQFTGITLPHGVVALTPSFSPDGTRLLFAGVCLTGFTCADGADGWNIYKVELSSKKVTQLTSQDVRLFRWYPIEGSDGTVYFSTMARRDTLRLANATSTASIMRITNEGEIKAYLPDVEIYEHSGLPTMNAVGFRTLIPFGEKKGELFFRARLEVSFSSRRSSIDHYRMARNEGVSPRKYYQFDQRLFDLMDDVKSILMSFKEDDQFGSSLRWVFVSSEDRVAPLHAAFDLNLNQIRRHSDYVAHDGENVFVLFSPDSDPGRAIWRLNSDVAERYIELPSGAYDFEFMAAAKGVIAASVSQVTLPKNFRHRISIWKDRVLLPEIFSITLDEGT
ncbi:MAG: hypothetical protein AAFN80_05635 [Pseudomonadota bacterium]